MSQRVGNLVFVCGLALVVVGGTAPASATPSNPGWMHFSSPQAGVSFDFPPLGGTVNYRFTQHARARRPCGIGDTGLTYDWFARGSLRNDARIEYPFAGGVSRDSAAGGDAGPYDIYRWDREGSGYGIDICGRLSPVTHVIEAIPRPDGSRVLVFDRTGSIFFPDGPPGYPIDPSKDVVAVVDFPSGHHGEFKSIVFWFLHNEGLSMTTIRRVIASVSFSKPTLAGTGSDVWRTAAVGLLILMVGIGLRASAESSQRTLEKPE